MTDEVLDTTLYLLHKRAQSSPTSAFPNIKKENIQQIAHSIKKKRNDPKLAEIVKKRNYYTQKIYQYINDSYMPEVFNIPETPMPLDKRMEARQSVLSKITNSEDAVIYISQNVLSDTLKRAEIFLFIKEQDTLQHQWSIQRDQIIEKAEEDADAYRLKIYRSMEGYHPLKLGNIRKKLEDTISDMENNLAKQLNSFDDSIYLKCVEQNTKIIRNLTNLGIPLFYRDKPVVEQSEKDKVLVHLYECWKMEG